MVFVSRTALITAGAGSSLLSLLLAHGSDLLSYISFNLIGIFIRVPRRNLIECLETRSSLSLNPSESVKVFN